MQEDLVRASFRAKGPNLRWPSYDVLAGRLRVQQAWLTAENIDSGHLPLDPINSSASAEASLLWVQGLLVSFSIGQASVWKSKLAWVASKLRRRMLMVGSAVSSLRVDHTQPGADQQAQQHTTTAPAHSDFHLSCHGQRRRRYGLYGTACAADTLPLQALPIGPGHWGCTDLAGGKRRLSSCICHYDE